MLKDLARQRSLDLARGQNAAGASEPEELENQEWIDSLEYVLDSQGPDRVNDLLRLLQCYAQGRGVRFPFTANTPYINTIPVEEQAPYPGNRDIERRIKSFVRWNAMAMVVRANREFDGLGGHISTYASAATLYEVAFNHFFRGRSQGRDGDLVFFQGHASPGVYARAFLEGRLTRQQLEAFRRELSGGLASYPHTWLMPNFWQFATVSMGLGPIQAIYQARFIRYLEDRGLKKEIRSKVWCFMGDGETDEPESLGAITLASREKLDNLVFVVNCNLQRLDGPVRGNGKIIQELEAAFRGAGWNVIKVVWSSAWDPLLARDHDGVLLRRMNEVVDGHLQKYVVSPGSYLREHFFGADPRLAEMVKNMSDDQLKALKWGGHDPDKVYAAYRQAMEHKGQPTVILAMTAKGYGLGEAGEGKNITHQQKKLNEDELREFRTRFSIPISDEEVASTPFYRPSEDSAEMRYLQERRQKLGGYLPARHSDFEPLQTPDEAFFAEFRQDSEGREYSTTMAFVRMLAKMLRDKEIGRFLVPIVPDEARTFGMETLFRQVGIYSHVGQLYDPVDAETLLYYKESTNGQILEEGITEAGSMASFIAAGTAYSTHGVPTIPFFIFYSMFGLQRIGDLVWAAGDMRTKGFVLGATSGRTTLNGEGLQHQDGHSHLLAYPIPNLLAYDPAFAYEVAVLLEDGLRRMYREQEDVFYYITLTNENYPMPAMPEGSREGILRGMYRLQAAPEGLVGPPVRLLGSGSILNEVMQARLVLADRYGVPAEVWSVTSYKALYTDALDAERWNLLHPDQEPRVPYVTRCLADSDAPVVAASDYVKALPESIARFIPGTLHSLGTDGYGRSETREALRDFFEVDRRYVALAALHGLARQGRAEPALVRKALQEMHLDPEKPNPFTC